MKLRRFGVLWKNDGVRLSRCSACAIGDILPPAEAAQHRRLPDDQERVPGGGEVAQRLEDQYLEDRNAT